MVIGFIGEKLRTHVVWSSYERAGHIILVLQHSGYAEVSDFDDVGFCQEDVLSFQVSMENIPLVQILKK